MIRVNRKKYNVLDSINSISPSFVQISYRASFDLHISYIKFFGVFCPHLQILSSWPQACVQLGLLLRSLFGAYWCGRTVVQPRKLYCSLL
jgi:hypothetical protein